MYDCIIVGAGIAGSVAARSLAEKGKKVLVIEKRNHIAGNCYDCKDENDILIHLYGPHIFHTTVERVYEFFSRFTDWYEFRHKVVANVHGELIPVPFNLNTLRKVYGEEEGNIIADKLIAEYGMGSRVPIMKLRENKDESIRKIADYVYENIFLHYTMKQWGQTPDEISPDVTARVPIVISEDDGYFADKYQGLPKNGFTPMVEKMLDHKNIEVRLSTDCKDVLLFKDGNIYFEDKLYDGYVIYTGAIDELFDLKFGRLPYRSLNFKFEHMDTPDFQGHSVVNYTVSEDYTRITEFKHLTGQKDGNGTTIVKEYPFAYTGKDNEIPYYAISNNDNNALYERYKGEAMKYNKLKLLGRLAEYRYYNIDAIADKALDMAATID